MNVWNLLKVNYKDTGLVTLRSIWYPFSSLQRNFTTFSSVFSVSIVILELVKSCKIGSKSNRSINWYIAVLLFVRNIWFIAVRRELRTCDTEIWNVAFYEDSLQFQVVNNFEKKLHFKIYCGVLKANSQ